jgi:hypothetical protein
MLVRKMEKQYITIQVTLEMVVQGELGEWRWSELWKHFTYPAQHAKWKRKGTTWLSRPESSDVLQSIQIDSRS